MRKKKLISSKKFCSPGSRNERKNSSLRYLTPFVHITMDRLFVERPHQVEVCLVAIEIFEKKEENINFTFEIVNNLSYTQGISWRGFTSYLGSKMQFSYNSWNQQPSEMDRY